jgi:hypothetical protein
MGIVTKALWRLWSGLGSRRQVDGDLFARAAGVRKVFDAIASISEPGAGDTPGGSD